MPRDRTDGTDRTDRTDRTHRADRSGRSARRRDRPGALPLDAESGRLARRARRVLGAGLAALAGLVALAALTEIREIARARGQLVPSEPPVAVEHLEGGRVAEVLAREGDVVPAGAVLLRLAPLEAEGTLAQAESRRAALALQRERLAALMAGRAPDFAGVAPRFADFAAEQRALYEAELRAEEAARAALAAEIAEHEAALAALAREIASAESRIGIAEAQLEMQENIFERGHSSRTLVLAARAAAERARAEHAEAERERAAAQRALADARSRETRREVENRRRWTAEIAETTHRLFEIGEAIKQAADRVERLVVTAPAEGVLHELGPKTRGEIVAPGDRLATIVPRGGRLVAEVRLAPSDIGHVRVGDPAEITVDTFDAERFGTLPARVEAISPTTFETEAGALYYRVRIALGAAEAARIAALLPGMTVEARIITGAKSVLRYLARPLMAPLEQAFTER